MGCGYEGQEQCRCPYKHAKGKFCNKCGHLLATDDDERDRDILRSMMAGGDNGGRPRA